ncbi:type II/IV secretion system ATPase subunit [Candidatus Woesearchaeota archaeon]|nr:type II/IV secretion system ATPase subunit [Candidatus Woesearchaeota archaeon]
MPLPFFRRDYGAAQKSQRAQNKEELEAFETPLPLQVAPSSSRLASSGVVMTAAAEAAAEAAAPEAAAVPSAAVLAGNKTQPSGIAETKPAEATTVLQPQAPEVKKQAGATQLKAGTDAAALAVPLNEPSEDTFYIDMRPRLVKLPPFERRKEINVRYPLVPPYAFAHIYWDDKANELFYDVEEPVLDDTERELLELIQLGLEEMINISFVRATKANILLQYLERNVQSILIEIGTKVNKKTYFKLMYYIYRDSVGLNEIEPLMNDYYVEDVECNGLNFPIYVVHRKYQNLRTNIEFKAAQYLTDFVEKLAQKSGRYVSYAKPLLDGTLPDGSRVNATYTEDITTRGPTFTIRKFTKDPWTPVNLIQQNTASAESFAFIWMVIENKFNVMTVGETGSGKTTFMNCIAAFIPPEARICSIEDTREINLAHSNWLPAVTRSGFGIPNIIGEQYGEISLFDLLRETFRQNPDYVIVGEVRGKEAYVLFQGMASGHPSFSTFHAASVDTLVKRLETPPINLSPSLVESLDVVIPTAHIKDVSRNFRRMKEIDEIIEVKEELGKARFSPFIEWDPLKDDFKINNRSVIFDKITKRTGKTYEELMAELQRRAKLLAYLAQKDMANFMLFNEIINDYYKDAEKVLKKFNLL